MPDTERTNETLSDLVKLVINQDAAMQQWFKFLVVLQSSLVTAMAYVMSRSSVSQDDMPHVNA